MYLAGILALCALLHAPVPGVGSHPSLLTIADAHSIREQTSSQEPVKPEPSAEASQNPSQPSPEAAQEPAKPQESPPASSVNAVPEKKPVVTQSANPATAAARKKKTPSAKGQERKRKVIRQGSTKDPITQLEPGMTDEQAARQRAATNQLLAQTDASLQKLSGRSLTKDQQDTVAQIRKFMEQVKTAQAAGDFQRAYKLAVKAHLLADALEKS